MFANWKLTSPAIVSVLALALSACGRDQRAGNQQQQTASLEQQIQQAEQQAQQAQQQAQQAEQQAQQARQRAEELRRQVAQRQAPAAQPGSPAADGAYQPPQTQPPVTQPSAPPVQEQPRAQQAPEGQEPRAVPQAAQPQTQRVIPSGTTIRVRLDQPLDSETNQPGDRFSGTLAEAVIVNGRTLVPQGTRFNGTVAEAESSGRLSGRGILALRLDSFTLQGRTYPLNTTPVMRETEGHGWRDVGIIGGSAAVGAAIGGLAGGGKGAAIGAGAGAAAGTAGAAATGKQDVRLPAETLMQFTLESPVVLRG
jgi:hypothetical protein